MKNPIKRVLDAMKEPPKVDLPPSRTALSLSKRMAALSGARAGQAIGFENIEGVYLPTYLQPELIDRHIAVTGPTGTGKTTRFIMGFLEAQIARNDGPVFAFDLKADYAAFHSAECAAKAAGRKFYHWTNIQYLSTYLWGALDQEHSKSIPVWDFCTTLLNCLGMWNGFSYGKFFFGIKSLLALATVLELEIVDFCDDPMQPRDVRSLQGTKFRPTEGTKRVTTFSELERRLREVISNNNEELKHADGILTVMKMLASQLYLNPSRDDKRFPKSAIDNALQMHKLLLPDPVTGKYPVVYFFMRAQDNYIVTSLVYKMFIYLMFKCLKQLQDARKMGILKSPAPQRVIVATDEFQLAVDQSISLIMEQGRDAGISFVMANQDISQYNSGDKDLTESIWANLQTKILFGANTAALQERLMKESGTVMDATLSYSESVGTDMSIYPSVSVSEFERPYLTRNEIIRASHADGQAIYFPANAQPSTIYLPHGRSWEEYQALKNMPWPAKTAETVIPCELEVGGVPPFEFLADYC